MKQQECAFCGSLVDVDELRPTVYQYHPVFESENWCFVCRSVLPMNDILDLRANLTNRDLARVVCAVANLVLASQRSETQRILDALSGNDLLRNQ